MISKSAWLWRSFQSTHTCPGLSRVQTTYVSFCNANTPHLALAHRSSMARLETHWDRKSNKTVLPSIVIRSTKTPMTRSTVAVPTFILTPATEVAVDPSVEQPPTNAYIWHVSSHVINYQHVSIASAIIIRVALQEYEEYNNLQLKCLKHWVVPLTHFCNLLYS